MEFSRGLRLKMFLRFSCKGCQIWFQFISHVIYFLIAGARFPSSCLRCGDVHSQRDLNSVSQSQHLSPSVGAILFQSPSLLPCRDRKPSGNPKDMLCFCNMLLLLFFLLKPGLFLLQFQRCTSKDRTGECRPTGR